MIAHTLLIRRDVKHKWDALVTSTDPLAIKQTRSIFLHYGIFAVNLKIEAVKLDNLFQVPIRKTPVKKAGSK